MQGSRTAVGPDMGTVWFGSATASAPLQELCCVPGELPRAPAVRLREPKPEQFSPSPASSTFAAQALLPPTLSSPGTGQKTPPRPQAASRQELRARGHGLIEPGAVPLCPLAAQGTGLGSCATTLRAGAGGRARAPTVRGCHLLALRARPWRLPGWMEHPAGLPGYALGAPPRAAPPEQHPRLPASPLPPAARGQGWAQVGTDLDGDGERLDAPQRALVEGVEDVVPHVGGLQDVPALPAGHEQGLVHLHGLVWGAQVGGGS